MKGMPPMTFVLILLCAAAVCCVLRNPLRRAPWLFYALAVAVDVLYFAAGTIGVPRAVSTALMFAMNKCLLPTALFVLVMYVGVFPKGGAVRKWLQPLRTPVSIVACILVLGHMVRFIGVYATRVLGGGAVAGNVLASFAIAVVLFALLAVLGVTSFEFVRRRMGIAAWRRVQRLAYPFYVLVYAHVLVMLGPAALNGGTGALGGVLMYTVAFGAYAVLRVRRALVDSARGRSASVEEACPVVPA